MAVDSKKNSGEKVVRFEGFRKQTSSSPNPLSMTPRTTLGNHVPFHRLPAPKLRLATNWCVITGAPSSGKSTVIQELTHYGYETKHDLVRTYIEEELKSGKSLEEIRGNKRKFYAEVLKINLDAEKDLCRNSTIVFDNAIPDNIAYQIVNGLQPSEDLLKASSLFQYRKVLIFDRFPVVEDGVRMESEEMADKLDALLELAYSQLGYEVVRVPIMSVQDRVDYVMYELNHDQNYCKVAN